MHALSTLLILTSALTSVLSITVKYDPIYDNGAQSLDSVACSDGPNGLESKGYTTFSSLRNFPNIGAASAVAGWNSAQCGSCWQLAFVNGNGQSNTVNVLAVDHAGDGFVLSTTAMNTLTGGMAVQLGSINAQAVQVDKTFCQI